MISEIYPAAPDSASTLLPHALNYADKWGWSVFPVPIGTKKSHKSEEYSGTKWGATRDPSEIQRDFTKWLDANIGVPTGPGNEIFVLDVDTVDGHGRDGFSSLAALETKHCPLPPTLMAESPSGSRHYVFRHPGIDVITRAGVFAKDSGIDVRGDGGMFLAAPSRKADGGTYRWLNAPHVIAVAPQWVLDEVCKAKRPESKITGHVPDAVGGISHDGIRYDELCWWIEQKLKRWEVDPPSNDEWISVGKRIKLSFPGEDGLSAFLAMSWEDQHETITRRWRSPTDFKTEGDNLETLPGLLKRDTAWMFRHVFGCPIPPAPPLQPLPVGAPLPEGWHWTEDGRTERSAPSQSADILPVFSAASLDGLPVPPRRWHVRGWIPAETVTLLYGDGGTGKSLIALQLLASTALGRPWLGRLVERGVCLFVTAEDSRDEVHRRLDDIARENSVPLSSMTDLHIVSLAGEDAILAAPDGRSSILVPTALFAALEAQCIVLRPTFVVLDTLADLFGGNEIDRSQARQFIGLLRGLALKYDITILLLAHPSVSGMTRGTGSSGSTGWNNSVRSRLYFDRIRADDNSEPDPDARVLRSMKSNYGRVGEEIVLHWRRGIFVPDSITAGGLMAANDARNRADEVFLKLLALYDAESRGAVSPNPGSNYAPKLFAEHAGAQGLKSRALKDAMDRLLASKRIEAIMTGPPSRMRQHLIVSDRNYQLTKQPTNPIPTPCQPPTNAVPTPLPTVPQTLPTPIPTDCYPNPHTPIALRAP